MSIGARVQKRLEELGMARRAASEAAKLNETFIRDLVDGRTKNPRVDSLAKLAVVLKTNVEWLRTGKGDPDAKEDPHTAEIIGIIPRLKPDDREKVKDYARFLASQSKKGG